MDPIDAAPLPNATPPSPPTVGSSGLPTNIAAFLAYLATSVTGVIFLVLEKENREVRFHAWQAIFFGIAALLIGMLIYILTIIFSGILSILGGLVAFLGVLIKIGLFVLWIICMIQAYKGEHFKLPIIGDLAEAQVNR